MNNDYTVCIILEIQTVPFRISSLSLSLYFRPSHFISTTYLHLPPQSFPVYTDCINRVKALRPDFALRMEEDEPFYPVAISLFRTTAVMVGSQRFAKAIEQLWGLDGISGFLFRDEDDFPFCLQISPR